MIPTMEYNDAELVAQSLHGSRDAFGQIVARYQTLICSLAYSATGSLTQSEDLSQETFVTAWKQLAELREPGKLRAWLCGIVRNLTRRTLRGQEREPAHAAEPLDFAQESPAPEPHPLDQAISREEEAILWRSLERIPETYREPLILFYREHESVERVAQVLDLSEDAVRQRLARGRKLLHQKVVMFVEGALRQTAPGQSFAGTVLAALPLSAGGVAATAGVGAAKGTAAAKGGGLLFLLSLPFIGVFIAMLGAVMTVQTVESPAARRRGYWGLIILLLLVVALMMVENLAFVLRHRWQWSDETFALVRVGYWWFFAMILATMHATGIRGQPESSQETNSEALSPTRKRVNALAFCGMAVGSMLWLFGLAWRVGDRMSAGIVAATVVLLLVWGLGSRDLLGEDRVSRLRFSRVFLGLWWGMTLLLLNWRLDVWMATARGTDLADAHSVLPMWIVHLGTLLLLLWAGWLMARGKAKG
ncbi:MAG: sigma-70 family RNA polymerase sigma factor [Verrucomicrobiota bacterium]